jgi:PTH1 family peptidyl-tRNA hydrolase
MLLFVGLGNPGSQYVRNRHNIGFMAVEAIARRHGFPAWKRRFQGVTTEGSIGGERVLLLLPGTYMNESGRAVQEAAAFYKIALGDIVVFQDEVELPPAKLRMKTGGGNAGHNGLRSISAHMGNDYRRVRLGVGHPGVKEMVHGHVLGDFSKADNEWLAPLLDAIAEHAELIARGQDATFQNKVHLAMAAKGFDGKGEDDKSDAVK